VKALQKLVRNGNATAVSIPRVMLIHLGWLPGQAIVIEELEHEMVLIRRPSQADFGPILMPRLVFDQPPAEPK